MSFGALAWPKGLVRAGTTGSDGDLKRATAQGGKIFINFSGCYIIVFEFIFIHIFENLQERRFIILLVKIK